MHRIVRLSIILLFALIAIPATSDTALAGKKAKVKKIKAGKVIKGVAKAVKKGTKPAKAVPIDLNTATEAQLRVIPGIGAAYAKKIIAGRPYKRKDDLLKRKVVPPGVYKKFSARIIAKGKVGKGKLKVKIKN